MHSVLGKSGEPIRLMTYSHDGFGLGHLRRTRDIARCVIRDVPGSSALMLIGCPSGSVFPLPAGIDYVKIPSVIKVDTEVWRMRSLHIDKSQAKALRASIIKQSAAIMAPQIFLVDHLPAGVWGELLPTLRMLKQRGAAVVLGIRDILDSPEVIRRVWSEKNFYKIVERYYDKVFIYGCRDIFDTASHYGLDTHLGKEKVTYCGYVCSDEAPAPRDQVRKELRFEKDRFVLITAGGGHDAFPMMQAALEAFKLLGKARPFDALIITGPLMEPDQRQRLRNDAAELGIPVEASVENGLSYMNAADLVITMAGYNSLSEILHLNRKALVVPRSGPSSEQMMRAKLFHDRGLIDVLEPCALTPRRLADRLLDDLYRTDYPVPDQAVELLGGRRAAAELLEFSGAQTAYPLEVAPLVAA